MKNEIFRIIDANFNRSREGLRVCEEIARFALDSEKLAKDLKTTRNKISSIAKRFERELGALSASRDSEGDVGRASRLPGGIGRKNIRDIFAANMERSKESLRVLEEFFTLIDLKASAQFSRIRFKAYSIEKNAIRALTLHK